MSSKKSLYTMIGMLSLCISHATLAAPAFDPVSDRMRVKELQALGGVVKNLNTACTQNDATTTAPPVACIMPTTLPDSVNQLFTIRPDLADAFKAYTTAVTSCGNKPFADCYKTAKANLNKTMAAATQFYKGVIAANASHDPVAELKAMKDEYIATQQQVSDQSTKLAAIAKQKSTCFDPRTNHGAASVPKASANGPGATAPVTPGAAGKAQ